MKLGLLNAYHWDTSPGNYQEKYLPMLIEFLRVHLTEIEFKTYNVAQNEFPNSVDECQAYLITGSPKSAYDGDAWVLKLLEFVREIDQKKIKLIGICFGHQVIAQALGGRVEKSAKGWGVGVRNFEVFKHQNYMSPKLNQCAMIFSHQDQVVSIPPMADILGRDSFCPIQIFSIGHHIFSMQGHPEFTAEYAQERLDTRIERIGEEKYQKATHSLSQKTNAVTVWKWVNNFLHHS